jgi:hypothetical protein
MDQGGLVRPQVTRRAVFEWVLAGRYMVERAEIPDEPDSIAIVGLVPDPERCTQHYFDSRGVTRLYEKTFAGGFRCASVGLGKAACAA